MTTLATRPVEVPAIEAPTLPAARRTRTALVVAAKLTGAVAAMLAYAGLM